MRFISMVGLALACTLPAVAQMASGPDVGSRPEPLMVEALTGPQAGMTLDYVAERREKPTLYVFLREFDRPIARYLRTLDQALKEDAPGAFSVAVWLTDQKDVTRQYLPRVQQSLKMESTALTLFPGDPNGPNGWNLNPSARVTTVLVAGGKVARTFAYASLNETDVPPVREALKQALK